MQHVIKKQVLDVTLSKKAEAFRVQQKLSRHFRQDVVPLLEKAFDALSPAGEVIHIDRLVIDLGVLSYRELDENKSSDVILSKITDQLHLGMEQADGKKSISRSAEAYNACRQWLFYMQHGYLPWNLVSVSDSWYQQVLETLATDFDSVAELKRLLIVHGTIARRIVWQHPESYVVKIIEIITAHSQAKLRDVVDSLSTAISEREEKSGRKAPVADIKNHIWTRLLQHAAQENTGLSTAALIKEIEEKYSVVTGDIKSIEAAEVGERIDQRVESESEEKEIQENEITPEGVFVQHAGLILVHPFLTELFRRLNFIDGGKFTSKAAQQSAMHLLHYIAAGNTAPEEYQLTISKVLCEWPLAMPCEKDITINAESMSEADNMLQALIEKWDVLKNSSADGVREGFLQRSGKLFRRNDKNYLQVEDASLDVLLDKLPWNISMVKLPWMKEILWVEWR